ncbi:MAG: DUF4386 domain-containing protein [Chloroflexota bacterium]|nr:MAG: DUF4386 domain-containing protein [Chloroflexota bacterium]
MLANISIGQICGFLFLFILLTSVLSQFLAGAALDPQDVPGTLGKVGENNKKFRTSVVIDLISHVSIIALAGLLYIAFSPYNQTLALLGTLFRVAEGTIIALTEVSNLVLLDVSQRSSSASGAQAVALESMGRTVISMGDWGYKIGLAFLVIGSLMYAILFVTSGAVPIALGWFGVIASLLAAGGILLSLINPNISMVSFLVMIPYEIVLGFWLLIWGGQIGQL